MKPSKRKTSITSGNGSLEDGQVPVVHAAAVDEEGITGNRRRHRFAVDVLVSNVGNLFARQSIGRRVAVAWRQGRAGEHAMETTERDSPQR